MQVDDSVSSDAVLRRALGDGDEDAFRELFVRHINAIYNFCFRRTASWPVAEDAVQGTFASLWRRAVAHRVEELRLGSARPILLAMARAERHVPNLDGLPRHQRDVVELVAFGEFSTAEVATALGISPGTVKSRLARVRAQLTSTAFALTSGEPC